MQSRNSAPTNQLSGAKGAQRGSLHANPNRGEELTSANFLTWLSQWKHPAAQFDTVITALRKRQLVGAHPCAKAATECIRAMLGSCRFSSTIHMMNAVRAMGRELVNGAPTELSIGNIVMRVLYMIREEYSQKLRSTDANGEVTTSSSGAVGAGKTNRDRSHSMASNASMLSDRAEESEFGSSVDIESDALPSRQNQQSSFTGSRESPVKRTDILTALSLADYADPSQQPSLGSVLGQKGSTEKLDFLMSFPDLRQNVIGAINELNDELDNILSTVSESAQDYIHADECILTFGHSETIASFLKAACRKRKFQLIVAEAEPGLSGHKLANELASHPNISVTIIPDSGVFALMARVNKVLISPSAVLVDGGAICASGNLMIAIAAKEYSVPVVGISGTYKLTPRFSHTQDRVLNNLQCPCDTIRYEENDVNFSNVDIVVPATEYIPPELINLYVTNNGSHQPSYVYRLMSEYYHPKDHYLLEE